jgi:hypothetical protein
VVVGSDDRDLLERKFFTFGSGQDLARSEGQERTCSTCSDRRPLSRNRRSGRRRAPGSAPPGSSGFFQSLRADGANDFRSYLNNLLMMGDDPVLTVVIQSDSTTTPRSPPPSYADPG